MENLSINEKKVLNDISKARDWDVFLGDIIHGIIAAQSPINTTGTPVNANKASQELTIIGAVVHGETLSINNPAVSGIDVYEFLADDALTKTAETNIPIDIRGVSTKASEYLNVDIQPISGDTMTIGGKTFIFVPVGTDTADGEISVGEDLAGAQAAIVAAINGVDSVNSPHPLVRAGAFEDDECQISAIIRGTAGNLIQLLETFTGETNGFGNTALSLGTDCSAADAAASIILKFLDSDTQGVNAAAGQAGKVALSAEVAGAAGNDIEVSHTMENASFDEDEETLSLGVDGTVTDGVKIMVDNSYLYVCLAANPVTGKNWRRISLGGVYFAGK